MKWAIESIQYLNLLLNMTLNLNCTTLAINFTKTLNQKTCQMPPNDLTETSLLPDLLRRPEQNTFWNFWLFLYLFCQNPTFPI